MALVKLSKTQLDYLASSLSLLRSGVLSSPKGFTWQTRRSLYRLGLLDYSNTLTEAGLDAARAAQDPDTLSYSVRRPA